MSWTQGNGKGKAVLVLVGSGLGEFVLALALSIHSSRGQSFDNSFRQNCRTEALKNCFSDQVVAKYGSVANSVERPRVKERDR
jgi:hypothetical protein